MTPFGSSGDARSRLAASSLLLILTSTVLSSACGSEDDAVSPADGLTTTTETSTTEASTPEGPVAYDVFLLAGDEQCDNVVASPRTSTVEGAPAEALAVLLAGPTAEEISQDWWSSFTPETAGMLTSLVITQFAGIERAVYSLDGDVDAFYYCLQLDPPAE